MLFNQKFGVSGLLYTFIVNILVIETVVGIYLQEYDLYSTLTSIDEVIVVGAHLSAHRQKALYNCFVALYYILIASSASADIWPIVISIAYDSFTFTVKPKLSRHQCERNHMCISVAVDIISAMLEGHWTD